MLIAQAFLTFITLNAETLYGNMMNFIRNCTTTTATTTTRSLTCHMSAISDESHTGGNDAYCFVCLFIDSNSQHSTTVQQENSGKLERVRKG